MFDQHVDLKQRHRGHGVVLRVPQPVILRKGVRVVAVKLGNLPALGPPRILQPSVRDREYPTAKLALAAVEAVNVLGNAQEGLRYEVLDLLGSVASQVSGDGSGEVPVEHLPCPTRARASGGDGRVEVGTQCHGGAPPMASVKPIDPFTATDTFIAQDVDKRKNPHRSGGSVRSPDRIRTGAAAVRGRCPRPLDDGALVAS